jgi:transposase
MSAVLLPERRTEMICAAVERCAGIDVGKTFLAVCVMTGPLDGEARTQKRRFGTIVAELESLREWLKQEGVTHVVMESTASYWKPVFNVLEPDFQVYLANSQEVKNRKGHKTDDKDGWWLALLLRHAMIHPSFIPPRAIRELRDLTRRRKRLLSNAVAEKNRIQKVLEDANVKLGNVLTDIFGVSGQLMLEALLNCKAEPVDIAQFAKGRARRRIPEMIQALEGHQMSEHHRQMIRYSIQHLEFLEEQIGELDLAIASKIKMAGLQQQWELLQTLPGVQDRSAATILAETGGDMEQFPTGKDLSSWAGVCPGNNRSAGKNKSSRTTGGNPWLRAALTECAWAAAAKKDCFLKGKFWRIVTKSGGEKAPAIIAVAHTLLLLIYQVLQTKTPFEDRTAPPLLDERQKQRLIRHHIRRLGKLGIAIEAVAPSRPGPGKPRRIGQSRPPRTPDRAVLRATPNPE